MASQLGGGRERRAFRRYPVLESGLIYTENGCIDCQVTEVSANGARVRPVEPIATDDGACRFVLARLGAFPAHVLWAEAGVLGMRFDVPPEFVAARLAPLLPAAMAGG